MGFLSGQLVTWASQSGGNWKTKIGPVCQVVPAGQKPDKQYTNLWKCGGTRDHESYIVIADGMYYWPRVSHLKPVKHDPTRTVSAENFMATLAANVDNKDLDDGAFRQFVRNTLPIVKY